MILIKLVNIFKIFISVPVFCTVDVFHVSIYPYVRVLLVLILIIG